MKIYSNVFDLARPVQRQIYVAPNSVYAFGIKIVNTGVPETDYQLKVFQNGVEIQPMDTVVDGFKLYQRTSPSAPTSIAYDVVYINGSKVQHFDLVDNTTNSTVFDIDQKGGAFELPIASTAVLGGVKVGKNLTIEADGTLNGKDTVEYTLGNGISIVDGNISIDDTVALKNEIPKKTSELSNDSDFATVSQIPTKLSQLENDAGYALENDIPKNISQLLNDTGYITQSDIPAIPTKTSELDNDSGFIVNGADITTPNLTVSDTAELTGTVTVDVENFLDATTGQRVIEQHATHNFQVEYEDGTTAQFDVWVNG